MKLLKFSSETCMPCKAMSKMLKDIKTDVEVIEYDLQKDSEKFAEYGVRAVPTLVIVEGGTELRRKVGACTKEVLIDFINQ